MIIIDNVNNDNLPKALKVLKKKWQDSGASEELRDRKYYTKPSAKKRVQNEKAVRKQLRTAKNNLEFKNIKQIPKKYIGL
jgi:small subunit ribosomal protein S21